VVKRNCLNQDGHLDATGYHRWTGVHQMKEEIERAFFNLT
jgi:hypothetical protein